MTLSRARRLAAQFRLCSAILLLLLATTGAGCRFNKFVADQMAPGFQDMSRAFNEERSVRHAREAAPGLLKMLDGFIRSSPDNPDLLLLAAEMNASFAFGLVEGEDDEWASELFRKAKVCGRKVLVRNEAIKSTIDLKEEKFAEALKTLGRDDVPPLFWTAFGWAGWINLNQDDPEIIADLPKVELMMKRVLELDESFFYGGAHLFLGITLCEKSLASKPKEALKHFERIFEITSNKYLMAHVLYAKHYAVMVQDKVVFLKALKYVREAPPDLLPEQALSNAIAKAKAAELLEEADDLILSDEE
jgi:hypothetical protein